MYCDREIVIRFNCLRILFESIFCVNRTVHLIFKVDENRFSDWNCRCVYFPVRLAIGYHWLALYKFIIDVHEMFVNETNRTNFVRTMSTLLF